MYRTTLIFFFFLSLSLSTQAEVFDLGKQGYTERVDIAGLVSENTALIQKELGKIDLNSLVKKDIRPPSLSFHTKLPVASAPRTFTFFLSPKVVYPDTTMVFFAVDQRCEAFLRSKRFAYGYCISYKSPGDVEGFLKRLGITYPVALISDDKALTNLGIKSWPAVLSVKHGLVSITEGGQ